MLGILLVDKPLGISSHDVVNEIRRRFGTKRVGHAGTLDPLATGVLVVAVGPATRFLQYLPLEPKRYLADIRFGYATETYDREGAVVSEAPVPEDLAAQLDRIRPQFLGLVRQIPPMYSAVKVGGKRLYAYARSGQQVARDPRTVHISTFDVLSVDGPDVKVLVECSGGTYVRTFANDLGATIGCGAHLSGLVREGVGRFRLQDTVPLAAAKPSNLIPLASALLPMPILSLSEEETRHVREGRQIRVDVPPSNNLIALAEPNGSVFSVARLLGNVVQPECVIPEGAILEPI